MKNIILQHWSGPMNELVELSSKSIEGYAKSIGADYQLLRGDYILPELSKSGRIQPPCQKLHLLDTVWDEYDNLVMVDADMFVRDGCTDNIFDEVGIGRHTAIQTALRKKLQDRWPLHCDTRYPYFGGSIIKMTRDQRRMFRQVMTDEDITMFGTTFHDEGTFHRLCVKLKLSEDGIYLPGQKWNYSSFEPDVDTANFIHIRTKIKPGGPKDSKINNLKRLVERGLITV